MTQRPYLNLGAGRLILPAERPAHHALVNPAIYDYPLWHNVDRNAAEGIDQCIDLFTYPWPLESDSYDGALLSHLCEHIPHEIKSAQTLKFNNPVQQRVADLVGDDMERSRYQDGWYAFFGELYRVLTDGALVHILSPHARSDGQLGDPTHTRALLPQTFMHSMEPNPDAPFAYATGGIHFAWEQDPAFTVTSNYQHLLGQPERLQTALNHEFNVAVDFYVVLRVIKT